MKTTEKINHPQNESISPTALKRFLRISLRDSDIAFFIDISSYSAIINGKRNWSAEDKIYTNKTGTKSSIAITNTNTSLKKTNRTIEGMDVIKENTIGLKNKIKQELIDFIYPFLKK